MQCEVIVVGAGIGGLTTAALLAARGVDVCLFERQSVIGGCVANFSHLGYTFEPTFGVYSGWAPEGTWQRILTKLPSTLLSVRRLSPNYVARLPNGYDVRVSSEMSALEGAVADAFPECADTAIRFLHEVKGSRVEHGVMAELLAHTSREFRLFVDAQLAMFAQCTSDRCSLEKTADAIRLATGELWSIDGGAQALADRLAESFTISGGSLRLNSPVLRLAYGADGHAVGVDLLNGERIIATRAIVSNLTVWDTYGKLIGPSRTPKDVAMQLKKLFAWGTYQMFLSLDHAAVDLPGPRTLLLYGPDSDNYNPEHQQLILNLSESAAAAPEGKRALTAVAFSQPEEWFSFHEDHSWHEEKDQATLEMWWARLHQALPELGGALEVIETSTPQTLYESTRRRFGMVGTPTPEAGGAGFAHAPFSKVFLVGDTVATSLGLEGVGQSALAVADQIAN